MQPIHIILGPPRSGLNTLTGCLRLLGSTSPPGRQDPATINNLLFQDLGTSPLSPAPLPRDWQKSSAADKASQRIHELISSIKSSIQSNTDMQDSVFISDSLLCRTLPLWKKALQHTELEPIFVLMLRHPFETASSIAAAENLDLTRAHLVWLAYTREAQLALEGEDHTLTTFDQLLADPVTTLNSLQPATYDLKPITYNLQPATYNLITHVQPSLKHHHAGDMTEEDRQAFEPYERLYQKIRAAHHQNRKLAHSTDPNDLFPLIDTLLAAAGGQDHQAALQAQKPAPSSEPPLQASIVFPASEDREETKKTFPLISGQWQKISTDMPEPKLLNNKPISFSPLNFPGTASIAFINFINKAANKLITSFKSFDKDEAVTLSGTAVRIPSKDNLDLLITGNQPLVTVKAPENLPDNPIQVEIWLKVSRNLGSYTDPLSSLADPENWKLFLGISSRQPDAAKLIKLADVFENAGCTDEAEAVLNKASQGHPEAQNLHMAFAELGMKRRQWDEAIRRWQDIAAAYGEKTPPQVYQRLDEAYKKQSAFPKGTQEEEARIGDGDKHEMLSLIHQVLEPGLYLEIGVQAGKSLALANCEAIGLDPMPQVDAGLRKKAHIIDKTSDDFFKTSAEKLLQNPPDLVFIDGMHLFEYALRDFINVERYSAPHTLAIIDDIFPSHPAQAERRRRTSAWAGDVWKLFEVLKEYRPDLFFLPINISPTGLLFIAGLDLENKILLESYEAIVSKYQPEMPPPQIILHRQGVFPSGHEAIPAALETLKATRSKLDLKPAAIAEELKARLSEYEQPDSP